MIEPIPALDLIDGCCVRLRQGDFAARTVYSADPLTVAKTFEAAGLKRLHLVDLDGARQGSPANLAVLERIASATGLRVDFSGGLRTTEDAAAAFASGAALIAAGSIAVRRPQLFLEWLQKFGAERLILAADVHGRNIAVSGWTAGTQLGITDFLQQFAAQGVRQVLCTDIARDGMLAGPSFELYTDLRRLFPDLQLTASGGVGSVDDIAALDAIGLDGVIIGKALYEERIALKELERFLC